MPIRQTQVWEAVCNCGCGRTLMLGKDINKAGILLMLQGWKVEKGTCTSPFCQVSKKRKQRQTRGEE